jgi:hypothetical protein
LSFQRLIKQARLRNGDTEREIDESLPANQFLGEKTARLGSLALIYKMNLPVLLGTTRCRCILK